jgi:hypothetical protein
MADFYQEARMGDYDILGGTFNGKPTFKQVSGDNYLYYMSGRGVSTHN